MDLILKRVKMLPKEIQDIINEFNVDHREQMRIINNQYYSIIYNNCRMCSLSMDRDIFWSVDYFIQSKYKLSCYWCSDLCFNKDKDKNTKENYLSCVKNFIKCHSIQYKDNNDYIDYLYTELN